VHGRNQLVDRHLLASISFFEYPGVGGRCGDSSIGRRMLRCVNYRRPDLQMELVLPVNLGPVEILPFVLLPTTACFANGRTGHAVTTVYEKK